MDHPPTEIGIAPDAPTALGILDYPPSSPLSAQLGQVGPEPAYSDALHIPDVRPHRNPMPAVAFSAAAVAFVTVISLLLIIPRSPQCSVGSCITPEPPSITAPPTPAPTTPPVDDHSKIESVLAVTAQTILDADDRFINQLTSHGMIVTNHANAITAGHRICQLLAAGTSVAEITRLAQTNNDLGADDVQNIITISGAIYCPTATSTG